MKLLTTLALIATALPCLAQGTESALNTTFLKRSVIPNTVAFDIANNNTFVRLADRPTLTGTKKPSATLGEASRVTDAFTLTILRPPKSNGYKTSLNWVPAFTFAFQNVGFDSNAAFFEDSDFQLFRVSLGYGPELSWNTPAGTFYATLAPGVAYSWVSWSSPVSGGSMGRSNANLALSIGYHKYITKAWALRAFVREVIEDTAVWNEAMDSSQGFDIPVESVHNTIIGASVAYSFGD